MANTKQSGDASGNTFIVTFKGCSRLFSHAIENWSNSPERTSIDKSDVERNGIGTINKL